MYKFFISILLCLVIFNCYASSPYSFQKELTKLLKNSSDLEVALVISDPTKNKILFERNKNKNFVPASSLKLFTAFSALTYLGSDFHYSTFILADTNNRSIHNLYLKFSGDPSLLVTDLDQLLKETHDKGITKITGSFIIDDSAQDQNLWSPGTILEDTKFCFCAPVSAIVINQNCINGEAIILKDNKTSLITNELEFVNIKNQLHYSAGYPTAELTVTSNNNYLLTGGIQQNTALKIAVQNNRLFSQKIIEHLLKKNHIEIENGIKFLPAPLNLSIVAEHTSEPLSNLISIMLKESNNVIANSLFRTLGTKIFPTSSNTWLSGSRVIKNLLFMKLHIPQNQLSIVDGSGASAYNLVKPIHLVKLLNFIYLNNYHQFRNFLPQSGIDGTLKNRMQNSPVHLYAKTGTETGVSTLSGYIETKKGHLLTFVIMIDKGLEDGAHYKMLEDQICNLIYNYF